MGDVNYLSERVPQFRSHQALTDIPHSFSFGKISGSVFYLPLDGNLGGDSFIIDDDGELALTFLSDIEGHGRKRRERITPHLEDLEHLASQATSREFDESGFVKSLVDLDCKLGIHNLLAFTCVRVSPSSETSYMNIGDRILLCSDGVFEYQSSMDSEIVAYEEAKRILCSSKDSTEVISRLNRWTAQQLLQHGLVLVDDYTVIALDLK